MENIKDTSNASVQETVKAEARHVAVKPVADSAAPTSSASGTVLASATSAAAHSTRTASTAGSTPVTKKAEPNMGSGTTSRPMTKTASSVKPETTAMYGAKGTPKPEVAAKRAAKPEAKTATIRSASQSAEQAESIRRQETSLKSGESLRIDLTIPDVPFQVNEAINTLRGNIQLSGYDIKTVCVTSTLEHEGKSSIAFRLAKSFAALGLSISAASLILSGSSGRRMSAIWI